jgi:predicted 3-demethylubiquinone-9 3-methyltransferase (glyoxalase superfamily)
MRPITPCLWFNGRADEAARFYTSLFENSRITKTTHYGDHGPGPKGSVMTVAFELNAQPFLALNAGPDFKFTPAVSLVVYCPTQEEMDTYWERLSAGGEEGMCGWLTDKFGLSWQVVPTVLDELVSDRDPKRSANVMAALMKMKKLEIAELKRAYSG